MSKKRKMFIKKSPSAIEQLEHRRMLAAHVVGSSTVYATIQAAVNAAAAGGTVKVDAGTYAEDVVINKTLTVEGAEAGIDPRGNIRQETGTESIVTGALLTNGLFSSGFTISANDVTVDGFTVQGETNNDLSAGAGIVISPNMSGAHVLNNIVQNNVSGLFLANNSSTDQAVIQHNIFRDNNNNGDNGGRGIYTDETESGGNLTNVLIDGNSFIGNYGGNGTTELEAGIALEASRVNAQSNITISNNVFDSNGKAMLFFNSTNVTIQGNIVTNCFDWYSGSVRFEGNNHNFTITQNLIYDNTGPGLALDSKAVPGDSSGFVINSNNIYGNGITSGGKFGIVFDGDDYDGTFDARNNYWGSASGPSGDGPGTGDSVYGIGHTVSGAAWNVSTGGSELYSPFSTAPIGTIDLPYWGIAATDGAKIQAEDFNHGGEGIAYHDTTTTNLGMQYRSTGVDIETTQDVGGGYDVGSTVAGEYLDYGINFSQTAVYRIDVRLASAAAGATFHIAVDGTNVTGSIAVPNTGGSQIWQIVSATGISLTSGAHTLRVVFDANNTAGVGPNFNWFELTNTSTLGALAAPTGVTALGTAANVALNWTATTGALWYDIYRGTSAGGEGATPIATGVTTTSYTDSAITAGTPAYYYFVTAVNGNTLQTNGQSPASAEVIGYVGIVATIPGVIQAENYDLGGEGVAYHDTDAINQGGAYRTDGVDIETTTDTGGGYDVTDVQAGEWLNYTVNVSTTGYYTFSTRVASLNAAGNFHIEIDRVNVSGSLTVPSTGGAQIFTNVITAPILVTAGSHVLRLAFDSAPATYVGNFNSITVVSVAPPGTVKLTGTPIGTSTSWLNNGDTIAQVFDGNLSTYFDAANGNLNNWAGLDMGTPQTITQIKYAPRAGYEFRMIGGQFQVSSTADFSSNVVTLYTISIAPVAGQLTVITVNPGGAYRYVRYVGGTQWVNIAEMEVDGTYTAPPTMVKIPGAPIGTQTSWLNNGDTVAQVFDGNFNSYFDAANGNLTNWAGLDMGVPQTISQLKFAPRAGYEFRMVGGQFQVSSTPDFSSNVVTIYTVLTAPVAGQFTTVNVSPGAAYRYVRYVGGTQWVNIAEMEVDGIYTAPPTPVKLTGTVIGTPTSWLNSGDTIAQVFDGNLNTYFDAANNSLTNWAGLDLGAADTITQIKYAPRAGYEFRMVGGQFQVSTTPDFSSNVVTVYTIATAPVAGQLTTISVSLAGPYRYVRYVGGNQWVNIAEMEVDGFTN